MVGEEPVAMAMANKDW